MFPFPKESLLVPWDVVATFPTIGKHLGIKIVTEALNSRTTNFPSSDCIAEAVSNAATKDQNFLQIYGTAMGLKNACSYVNLAGNSKLLEFAQYTLTLFSHYQIYPCTHSNIT